jgi:hypothetical protein
MARQAACGQIATDNIAAARAHIRRARGSF